MLLGECGAMLEERKTTRTPDSPPKGTAQLFSVACCMLVGVEGRTSETEVLTISALAWLVEHCDLDHIEKLVHENLVVGDALDVPDDALLAGEPKEAAFSQVAQRSGTILLRLVPVLDDEPLTLFLRGPIIKYEPQLLAFIVVTSMADGV